MSRPENELTIAAGPPKKLVRRRVAVLDSLRGATLVSMVLYHACCIFRSQNTSLHSSRYSCHTSTVFYCYQKWNRQ